MLKFELRKFFIKQYAIVFFVVVIFIKLITSLNIPNANYSFHTNYEREAYVRYMNTLNGALDEEKEEFVISRKTELLLAQNRVDDLSNVHQNIKNPCAYFC